MTDPSNVMAGLDPSIHTDASRAWMPGSRPGMTVRVTNNEIWHDWPGRIHRRDIGWRALARDPVQLNRITL
jgi:hypothetical protein